MCRCPITPETYFQNLHGTIFALAKKHKYPVEKGYKTCNIFYRVEFYTAMRVSEPTGIKIDLVCYSLYNIQLFIVYGIIYR